MILLKDKYPCKKPCKEYLITLCQNATECDGPFLLPCNSPCMEFKNIGKMKQRDSPFKWNRKKYITISDCDNCNVAFKRGNNLNSKALSK